MQADSFSCGEWGAKVFSRPLADSTSDKKNRSASPKGSKHRVSGQAPVAMAQRPLNALFVRLLTARHGSGVREEKLKRERLRFCALGLFWDNDKGHESQGMLIEPGRVRCLNGSPEQLPGKVSRLVVEKVRRERRHRAPDGTQVPELGQDGEGNPQTTTDRTSCVGHECERGAAHPGVPDREGVEKIRRIRCSSH